MSFDAAAQAFMTWANTTDTQAAAAIAEREQQLVAQTDQGMVKFQAMNDRNAQHLDAVRDDDYTIMAR